MRKTLIVGSGRSVFLPAAMSNTIIALAIRLADKIKQQMIS